MRIIDTPAPGGARGAAETEPAIEVKPGSEMTAIVIGDEPLAGQALASAIKASGVIDACYRPDWASACRMFADPAGKALVWLADSLGARELEQVRALRAAKPEAGICLIARRFDAEGVHCLGLQNVGRLSVLLRTRELTVGDIARSLIRLKGRTVTLTPDVLRELARRRMSDDEPLDALTPDERAVLELTAMGLRNREIARRLHRSEKLIEKRIASIFQKLNLNGRRDAVDRRVAAARIFLLHEERTNVIAG